MCIICKRAGVMTIIADHTRYYGKCKQFVRKTHFSQIKTDGMAARGPRTSRQLPPHKLPQVRGRDMAKRRSRQSNRGTYRVAASPLAAGLESMPGIARRLQGEPKQLARRDHAYQCHHLCQDRPHWPPGIDWNGEQQQHRPGGGHDVSEGCDRASNPADGDQNRRARRGAA